MQQALASPVFRSIAIGSLLLALTAAQVRAKSHHTRRLVLHAVAQPYTVYISAWRHGDLRISLDDKERTPLTFHTRARVNDGCRWMGTETLEPIDAGRYWYRYTETILDCEPDATPYIKTPRTGVVTVED